MDLRTYGAALRRSWWIVLLIVVAGAGAGVLMTLRATPQYQSTVQFFVSTPSDSTGTPYQSQLYAQRRINSYLQLLDSEDFANRVIATSGVTLTTGQVQSAISATTDLNTVLMTATVTDSVADRSLSMARAVSTEFGALVAELDARSDTSGVPIVLNVLSGPTLDPTPVSPRPSLNIGLGVLVGLALGVGVAVIRQLRDKTVRSATDLRELSGVPSLGEVAADATARSAPVLTGELGHSPRAEEFRQIRTSIQFADVPTTPQVLVVTSAVAGETKSSTAANLAVVFAETGRRVLLVEADMRRPRISDYLGLERAVGLSNVLARQAEVGDVLQPWGEHGMFVLPSGSTPPNPSELLGSKHMIGVVDQLRASFDVIVVDTPPLLPVTDAVVAATWSDGVVLVVRHGRSSATEVGIALQSLASVEAPVLGTVLAMAPGA